MRLTRKRFRILFLAAIVAALAVPVGFALSLDPAPVHTVHHVAASTASTVPSVPGTLPTLVDANDAIASAHTSQDAAKLLLVGTVLFGLAAAVRKAI
jgi:hypothetical protein